MDPVQDGTDITICRSNHTRLPSQCLRELYESHYVQVMESTFIEDSDLVTNCHPMLAYVTADASDIMTWRQAMQALDVDKFREGMEQEFNDHCNKEHWAFVLRSSLPPGTKVLPAVWAMHHKHQIATSEVYKWKAHLNIHGGHQIKGVHYWDTYSPMVRWALIQLALPYL